MPFSGATHGVTTETVERFYVDAGAVFLNYGEADERPLGATRGGNTFTVEQDVREMEIDGLPGPLAGARRIVTVRPTIEANLLELGTDNMLLALTGAEATAIDQDGGGGGNTHDSIRRSRSIALSDYITNIALVGEVLGTTRRGIFIVYNAISTENFEIGTSDEDEAVLTLTLAGHFNAADLDATGVAEEPWEIRWPIVV